MDGADGPKSCGFLLLRGDPVREFLLMQHSNRWDLPKGHVDCDETELQCAYRELREETGIAQDAVRLDPDFRFILQYPVRSARTGNKLVTKTLIVFLGHVLRDVSIVTSEHPSYQWFPWEPPHHIQPQTIDPLLAAVEAHLSTRNS